MRNTDVLRTMNVEDPEDPNVCKTANEAQLHQFDVLIAMYYLGPYADPNIGPDYEQSRMNPLIRKQQTRP